MEVVFLSRATLLLLSPDGSYRYTVNSGLSIVLVCGRQQYQHYIIYSGNRHNSARCVTLVNPTCAKRIHRHYTGQPAL